MTATPPIGSVRRLVACLRQFGSAALGSAVLVLAVGFVLLVVDRWMPPPSERGRQTSALVLDARGRLLRGFTVAAGNWRLPARPEEVDPLYLRMLLAYEDQRFASHFGLDPLAVARALGQWLRQGRVVSGASTLTMQTARLLEPHSRDVLGKIGEMARALQLEWRHDKTEILGFYLTLAPFGGNLEGVRAASLAWFGKEPTRLTAAEAALLVVLPQAPSRLRPDRFPERARAARDKVLLRMGQLGVLDAREVSESRQEPLPIRRRLTPLLAPHLAGRLRATRPQAVAHFTFINQDLQQTLEALAKQRQSQLEPQASIALLVVENRSRRVRAYVGASDFFDTRRAGQVDMVRAIRSPGSTLKPLVYGLAFDELLIHPETLLEDVPTRFGGYAPANFHNTYAGQLTVREALQQSLNVPAVAVLEHVGPARVAARLREVGLPPHWNAAYPQPGLPLVLGGVGMSLEQLVTLYAGFANGGLIAPLRFSEADPATSGQPLLTEAACWYLTDILGSAPPPGSLLSPSSVARPRSIAYKTGTSYGFRDAWAFGYDADHTVGVWVGRPDGSPSPGHYGRNTAAPLLFRVFDLLPEAQSRPVAPPAGVLQVGREQLPERLRYFRTRPAAATVDAPPLGITFPIAGSTVELSGRDGTLVELPLAAKGGVKPLHWLVNGRPLGEMSWRQEAFWKPDGEGLARIVVLDQAGQTATVEVWISRSP
ncbi:MAG: penicillin-binding protein 1C [Candidatus Competibacteraceae bacterium]|nr:penicillin-binding protein 1C [Candidatus Competibacteraceae bacterium]MBK8899121.1 penicillin-binding protein 1C [Candidatus Competibacteraceae bacterium]